MAERGMIKILIVDDEKSICDLIDMNLSAVGYQCKSIQDGLEAIDLIEAENFDLVLLDVMLPGLDGEEVLPRIMEEERSRGIPVIVVSAKVDIDKKAELLLGGAADYVTKPFAMKELLARISVQLRRPSGAAVAPVLEFGGITLNTDTHMVSLGSAEVRLTRTEYAILKLLMGNPSQVVTKSLLLERISRDTPDCTDRSLKMHVSNLRKKLREATGKDYIEAVWGIGFKMRGE